MGLLLPKLPQPLPQLPCDFTGLVLQHKFSSAAQLAESFVAGPAGVKRAHQMTTLTEAVCFQEN